MKTSSDAPRKPKKSYLSRKTLYSKVHRASEESIVLIIAPPGYGKSAFASEWYWSLAQCDAAEVAYFRIEPQDPHSVEQIEEFLSGANGAESFSNWHIIIEEANLLAHDEAARIFPCLVRATNAGAKALLTAASWTDSLTQMYMRQEAVVLGKNELAFSEQEVKACLEALAGKSQAREYVKRVFDFTQGWPAGVHLLAINAEGNKEAFSFGKNKYIDAYFSAFLEETFSSAEIDFISKTACLDELSADVCDYVTGRTDGRETLKKLELAGAYLTFDGNDTDATCHYDRPFRTWLRSSLLLKS